MRSVQFASLSRERRQLLLWTRSLCFGWLENLRIHQGEPVLNPLPKRIREVKFQGEGVSPLSEAELRAPLRQPELEMLNYFDQVVDVTIERLLVKYSMPFKADSIDSDTN